MIMDDNKIMEAAQLIANSSAALIQAMGMMSENIERANRGESLAYTENSFMKLIQDNGITYNDVIQRGMEIMKNLERVNKLNKMLSNANEVAYEAMVDLIKKTGRLNLDLNDIKDECDFPAEIKFFTDNGLVCLSITSIYLSEKDKLRVDGYDDDNEKIEGVDIDYSQIDEVVYLAKVILEEEEEKRSWEKRIKKM